MIKDYNPLNKRGILGFIMRFKKIKKNGILYLQSQNTSDQVSK